MKEYALYKGEEILAMGTIPYIARVMGVQRQTIAFYKTQVYKNRLAKQKTTSENARILVSLDGWEDDLDGL